MDYEYAFHPRMSVAFEVVDDYAYFAVAANGLGWVAFGQSETGNMIGATFCVVYERNGRLGAYEYYSKSMSQPFESPSNNCELLDFQVNAENNQTYAKFRRPTIGCKDFAADGVVGLDIVRDWDTKFIGAFGTSLSTFSYHGTDARGVIRANPFYGPFVYPPLPDDAEIYDGIVDDWQTGSDRDIYYCKGHYFPSDRRYHVVQYDALLGNKSAIEPAFHHHLILYSCASGELGNGYEDLRTRPCGVAPPAGCPSFAFGWALGQQMASTYPAGFPIGGGEAPVHRAVVAQAHVDHPTLQPGIELPAWGLRLWYTPTMQEFEGVTFGHYIAYEGGIPPGLPNLRYRGEIPPNILNAHIPPEGLVIQVISAHAHGLQVGWKLQIIRDGIERHDLGFTQNSWDYNTQDGIPRSLNHELRLFPGDRFLYTCIYDTTNRTDYTYWGESFEDEMCILYMNAYPLFQNAMTTCWIDGRDPTLVDPEEEVIGGCIGNKPPYIGVTTFEDDWVVPAIPSICAPRSSSVVASE